MSDLFTALAEQARGAGVVAGPRPRSRFEPAGAAAPEPFEVVEERDAAAPARSAPATRWPAAQLPAPPPGAAPPAPVAAPAPPTFSGMPTAPARPVPALAPTPGRAPAPPPVPSPDPPASTPSSTPDSTVVRWPSPARDPAGRAPRPAVRADEPAGGAAGPLDRDRRLEAQPAAAVPAATRPPARVALAPPPPVPVPPPPAGTPTPQAPVLVTIGKVEVRAVLPPARPADRRPGPPRARTQAPGLSDYLARLDRGTRR
jgi:hypothetical protein